MARCDPTCCRLAALPEREERHSRSVTLVPARAAELAHVGDVALVTDTASLSRLDRRRAARARASCSIEPQSPTAASLLVSPEPDGRQRPGRGVPPMTAKRKVPWKSTSSCSAGRAAA